MFADWSNRTIQRKDRKECSALSVVVLLMLVGSVAADTKATKEMLTHSTTTQSRLRTVIRQYQAMRVVLAVAVSPMMD